METKRAVLAPESSRWLLLAAGSRPITTGSIYLQTSTYATFANAAGSFYACRGRQIGGAALVVHGLANVWYVGAVTEGETRSYGSAVGSSSAAARRPCARCGVEPMRHSILPVFIAALAVGVAPSVQAGPAMFQASFIVHALGNDVTTGASYPFNTSVFTPMPLGTTGCAPSPYYCPPNSQRGRPATGTGSISVATTGTGPAPIALPQSAFGVTTRGFWPIGYPLTYYRTYYSTYATFVNAAGSFFAGGGPETYTFTSSVTGMVQGKWSIQPGSNRFGGKLGLLGVLGAWWVSGPFGVSSTGHWTPDTGHWTTFTGHSSWNMIKAMGRGSDDPDHTYTNTGMFYNLARTQTITYTAIGRGTLWTTGSVTVSVPLGTWITILRRAGHDTTTPGGVRNIQLVTPALTHWIGTGSVNNFTGHIGVLTLQVPEPHAVLLLAAGAGVLVVLRRASRRD